MASKNTLIKEDSGVQEDEQNEDFAVVGESPELRASVVQDIQAKVDTNHPNAKPDGMTLEAAERMQAREDEIERTARRFDRRQDSDREARARQTAADVSRKRRQAIDARAVVGNPAQEAADPRAHLSQAELAVVNQEADRLAKKLPEWSRAAISRRLGKRVRKGMELSSAVLSVFEDLRRSGRFVPINAIGDVNRGEVDIEGTVRELWSPSSATISQVGLLEDDSGRVKFTAWQASNQPWLEEGERVRLYNVATNWYEGRVSVALTGWSRVHFPERGQWWTE
ncbi:MULTISPECIES: DNA-binding protein [Salinibaculum]|uniref:DNA-binding protein n=1 Tax=Salinibaculum TaxID=2732368 RepID=UPI0030D4A6B5